MNAPSIKTQSFAGNDRRGQIAFVIPTLNEARHIRGVLMALIGSAERLDAQFFVVDGGSRDGTQDLVLEMADQHPRITLVHNPKRLQSAAVNLVVTQFGGRLDWILRVDAHADYPDDYGDVLLAEAEQNQADSVVVRMHAIPTGHKMMESNIAAAQNAIFGNGGSAHRGKGDGRFVDHGHHALMRVDAFRAVGGYNEAFSHAEDVELDQRLVKAGYRIWLTGATGMAYFPRQSLTRLAIQYYRFGAGRMANFRTHPDSLRKRHVILISLAPIALLSLLSPMEPLLAMPMGLWLLVCLLAGGLTAWKARRLGIVLCGLPGAVMQLSWSLGFWGQALRYALLRSGGLRRPRRVPMTEDER